MAGSPVKPLVVTASEREGLGLVERWSLVRDHQVRLRSGDHEKELGLYRGDDCDLLISGVLEHHMTAATALVMSHLQPDLVVNFGACGTYAGRFGNKPGPQIGQAIQIASCYRFDVDDNLHWVPPRRLNLAPPGLAPLKPAPPNLPIAHCVTGSRYSRAEDYQSEYFPKQGQVEDMELYGLAVLLETFDLPLYSIKFVTNEVEPQGRQQFRANVVPARRAGEEALCDLLPRISRMID